ncbi:MAG: S8 family serine peptidase [Candidatus Riflebacteria bacterium]|nr:S8 family serine peptidase [Candidatus Riflebacteria bacterium]
MRRFGIIGLALAAAVFFSPVSSVASDDPANPVNRWIVKFRTENPVSTVRASDPSVVIHQLKAELARNLGMTKSVIKLANQEAIWAANAVAVTATPEEVRDIEQLANVEGVYPVKYRKWITDGENPQPAAPSKAIQWSVAKVKAPEVWEKFKVDGSGIVVGHIDTGIDAKHPLLAGKVLLFKDFTALAKPEAYDDQGHGTHTAGSICGSDGVGVAPGAKLIVAKVFTKSGSANDEEILKSMQWMMDPDGNPDTNDMPRLVSNSWGGSPETTASGSFFFEITNNWVAAGIFPVFAAGNSGPKGKVGSPANFKQSWAVAATTNTDGLAYFSSIGSTTFDGETYVKPDIAAPGAGVVSCKVGGGLVSNSGTSMACPHVAGLAALMLQANPKITISEMREIAEATAIDLGDKGKDNKFGSGRFDALACITKIVPQTPPANVVEGYKMALETEQALIGKTQISPLAAPMATYMIEKAKTLDSGEFNSLRNQYSSDSTVTKLLNQAAAAREFERIHY